MYLVIEALGFSIFAILCIAYAYTNIKKGKKPITPLVVGLVLTLMASGSSLMNLLQGKPADTVPAISGIISLIALAVAFIILPKKYKETQNEKETPDNPNQ